eukprot:21426-Prymnesium_polylepis.1
MAPSDSSAEAGPNLPCAGTFRCRRSRCRGAIGSRTDSLLSSMQCCRLRSTERLWARQAAT